MNSEHQSVRNLREIELEVLDEGREWTRHRLEQALQAEAHRHGGVFPLSGRTAHHRKTQTMQVRMGSCGFLGPASYPRSVQKDRGRHHQCAADPAGAGAGGAAVRVGGVAGQVRDDGACFRLPFRLVTALS